MDFENGIFLENLSSYEISVFDNISLLTEKAAKG